MKDTSKIEYVQVRITPGSTVDVEQVWPVMNVTVKAGDKVYQSQQMMQPDELRSHWDRMFDMLKEELKRYMIQETTTKRRTGPNAKPR